MKVFEVITEHCKSGSKEIITTRRYVTSFDDSLQTVAAHFTAHCEQFEESLKGVTEVVTITEQIREPD